MRLCFALFAIALVAAGSSADTASPLPSSAVAPGSIVPGSKSGKRGKATKTRATKIQPTQQIKKLRKSRGNHAPVNSNRVLQTLGGDVDDNATSITTVAPSKSSVATSLSTLAPSSSTTVVDIIPTASKPSDRNDEDTSDWDSSETETDSDGWDSDATDSDYDSWESWWTTEDESDQSAGSESPFDSQDFRIIKSVKETKYYYV